VQRRFIAHDYALQRAPRENIEREPAFTGFKRHTATKTHYLSIRRGWSFNPDTLVLGAAIRAVEASFLFGHGINNISIS